MIRTENRMRPTAHLIEKYPDLSELLEPAGQLDPRDHRDRGRFLTPRLYPEAAFDPWEPVAEPVSA